MPFDLYRSLAVDLPPEGLAILRRDVRTYYEDFARLHVDREHVAVHLAEELCLRLEVLIDTCAAMSTEHRAAVVGAARYFVSAHGVVPDDVDFVGLDDDAQIFNHVARMVGRDDLTVAMGVRPAAAEGATAEPDPAAVEGPIPAAAKAAGASAGAAQGGGDAARSSDASAAPSQRATGAKAAASEGAAASASATPSQRATGAKAAGSEGAAPSGSRAPRGSGAPSERAAGAKAAGSEGAAATSAGGEAAGGAPSSAGEARSRARRGGAKGK